MATDRNLSDWSWHVHLTRYYLPFSSLIHISDSQIVCNKNLAKQAGDICSNGTVLLCITTNCGHRSIAANNFSKPASKSAGNAHLVNPGNLQASMENNFLVIITISFPCVAGNTLLSKAGATCTKHTVLYQLLASNSTPAN